MTIKHILRTMLVLGGGMLATFSTAFATGEARPWGPDSDDIRVERVVAAGSGCREGSASGAHLNGTQVLSLEFGSMTATDGGRLSDTRKNCQYNIELSYPAGWTFAVQGVLSYMQGQLAGGKSGEVKFSSYFQGQRATDVLSQTVSGARINRPFFGFIDDLDYAPCHVERSLNVNGSVRVKRLSPGTTPYLGELTLQGPIHLLLDWKRCD